MHGLIQPARGRRRRLFKSAQRRRQRRQIRHGVRAAVRRAVTSARLYLNGTIPNLVEAAESCGSNVQYVRAAIILLRSGNAVLLERVLRGHIPLLAAAAQVRQLVELVDAYRKTSVIDHAEFGRQVGPAVLWDQSIVPAISA